MPLFSPRPKSKIILILDIQSSMVRTILARFHLGEKIDGKSEIFWTQEREMSRWPHSGGEYLIRSCLKRAEELAGEAARRAYDEMNNGDGDNGKNIGHGRISEVHFALSSPWIVSNAKTLSLSFPKEIVVNKKTIMEHLEEERKRTLPEGAVESEFMAIEEKIFDVRVNGYSMEHWEGKSAKELSVSFVTSIAGRAMTEKLREAIGAAHAIHGFHEKIFFHSALLLQYTGIKEIMSDKDDYVLVRVHGTLTDILVVDRGNCSLFASFPTGVNSIVGHIANINNVSATIADSLLSLHIGKHIDADLNEKAAEVIDKSLEKWGRECATTIESGLANSKNRVKSAIIFARTHEEAFIQAFKKTNPGIKVEEVESKEEELYARAIYLL